jgi:hypothetical protein
MPNPKKILVISPVLIPPAKGGNSARIDSFCNALEDLNHEVHFLYISNIPGFDTITKIPEEVIQRWSDKFHHFNNISKHQLAPQHPRNLRLKIKNKILHTLKSEKFFTNDVDDFIGYQSLKYVQDLQGKLKFDLVICNYVVLSKLLTVLGGEVKKVMDTHDILGNRHLLFHERKINNKWISITPDSEAKSLNRADVIIGIQETETEYFKKSTHKKVVTLKHFVQLIMQGG